MPKNDLGPRGSWLVGGPQSLELASHESGHASVGCLLGLRVLHVRIDQPHLDADGETKIDVNFDLLLEHLIATVAGPLAAGREPPGWPLDSSSKDGDERAASLLAQRLNFSEDDLVVAGRRDVADAEITVSQKGHQRRRQRLVGARPPRGG